MQKLSAIANQPENQSSLSGIIGHHQPSFFFKTVIQPKLSINQPNDIYEQEADAVANKVMRMTDQETAGTSFFQPAISPVQRMCAHCGGEEKKMQRKVMSSEKATADSSLENYVDGLSKGGRSLPKEVRNFYEPRMGYDFSNVKVHTDTVAAKSAQSINALAYTSGNNIVFNSGQYSPNTDSGKKLLGHELTHVVQQNGNIQTKKIQRMIPCPAHLNSGESTPAGWKDYFGSSCMFHCCYRGILEDRTPSTSDPQNECFYDNSGTLVDASHPYAGCRGTPNSYDSSSDWIGHTFLDPGGIWQAGWGAWMESGRHSEDERRANEAECFRGCESVNIFFRGFCIDGCLGLPPM